jgi:peptidoglycan biosynthesis protein MviN/MurJ (putative lipid II flippase)
MRRLRALSDLDRALARNVLLVSLFVAIAGVARLGQEMAIAWKFGAGAEVDAYYFVSTFLNWPVGVWFSVLVVVVVPTEATLRRKGPGELMQFRSELFGLTLAAALVVTLVTLAAFGGLLYAGRLGLSHDVQDAAVATLPALAWLVPLGLPIGLLSAWIIAAGRHTNTLIEATPAIVVIVLLIAVPGPTFAVLLWGTAIGFAARLLVLGALLRWRNEMPRPRLAFAASAWAGFWKSSAAMVTGQVLITMTALVDQLFAARLGEGAVATLAYANRVILMVQALTALVAQRASLPLLAESFASGGAQDRGDVARGSGARGDRVGARAAPGCTALRTRRVFAGRYGARGRGARLRPSAATLLPGGARLCVGPRRARSTGDGRDCRRAGLRREACGKLVAGSAARIGRPSSGDGGDVP